jgi:hypothetical protein
VEGYQVTKDNQSGKSSYNTTTKGYKAFLAAILRQKAKYKNPETLKPGILTSFYIDCFLTYEKKVCAEAVVDLGLCEKGNFTEWRNEQRKLGNLDWDVIMRANNVPEYKYKAGPKVNKHLEKIGSEQGLMASKGYVDKRIDELRAEMMAVIETVKQDYFDRFPPRNDEREEELESNLKKGKAYIDSDRSKKSDLKFAN